VKSTSLYRLYLYEKDETICVYIKQFRRNPVEHFSYIAGWDGRVVKPIGVVNSPIVGYDYIVVAIVDEDGLVFGFHPLSLLPLLDHERVPSFFSILSERAVPFQRQTTLYDFLPPDGSISTFGLVKE